VTLHSVAPAREQEGAAFAGGWLRRVRTLCLLLGIVLAATAHSRAATYATWIMVWHGHDQAWWNANAPDGLKNPINGQWKALDWADPSLVEAYLDGLRQAGINVVIADLTNGWNWLGSRCQLIQSLCAKKGLKFCVAENSAGNVATFESHAQDIWTRFAAPEAPWHDTYFQYHGKPLIVCYAIRAWYQSYLKSESAYRSRFNLVWASGEDSNMDKWGWQLEPWVGPVPSREAMFVTPSIRWNPSNGVMWRKSLAWLDYGFALASKSNPAYVIVGSYDDPSERNSWLVSDTSHCEPGRQMRDWTGALSPAAYYDRVAQWIAGKPSLVPGGLLPDGAYRIISRAHAAPLGIVASEKSNQGTPGAALGVCAPAKAPQGCFWLYHLGGNCYRIITLESGLALEASNKGVAQNWDSSEPSQHWVLSRGSHGCVRLINSATGLALTLQDGSVGAHASLHPPSSDRDQQWRLEPELPL